MRCKFLMHPSIIVVGILIVAVHGLLGQNARSAPSTQVRSCEKFRTVTAGEIVDGEATKAGFRTIRSSKTHLGFTVFNACGETMTVQYGEFASPQDAKRYLDWNLSKASRIVTQGPKTDSKGNQVGYRAELLLQPDKKQLAVMWTTGVMFRAIFASSIINATGLEKRYGN